MPPPASQLDPLLALARRERALQRDVQDLLDAQSAGLVEGRMGANTTDDRSSEGGSSTPTTYTSQPRPLRRESGALRNGVVPVRQPAKKQLGLRAARKGILRSMQELAHVKEAELEVLDMSVHTQKTSLAEVEKWERKLQQFDIEMERLEEAGEGRELLDLKADHGAVQAEIRELEERLMNMRARERALAMRVGEVENKRDSEMSSYKEAKKMAERQVRDFLLRVEPSTVLGMAKQNDFFALPPQRRTLGMAREWYQDHLNQLSSLQKSVEAEHMALREGENMWSDSIRQVSEFERDLRAEMSSGELSADKLQDQLAKMSAVRGTLQAYMQQAEEKGWNLIICALGAEIEAFKEGEDILRSAVGLYADQTNAENERGNNEDEYGNQSMLKVPPSRENSHGLDELNGLSSADKSHSATSTAYWSSNAHPEESDDDGPDPELLVSHEHTDDMNV